jgi:hypothetical protein
MDCRDAAEKLEQCFDAGSEYPSELDAHLDGCAVCRAKLEELHSIERMLHALPFEAPGGIEDRIMTALMQEHGRRNRPVVIAVLAACTLLGTGAMNWLLPVRALQDRAWRYMASWIPDTEWLGARRPLRDQVDWLWTSGSNIFGRIEWFSQTAMWSALATAIVLSVVLNGICVARLRHSGR